MTFVESEQRFHEEAIAQAGCDEFGDTSYLDGLRVRYLDGPSRQWVEEWDRTAEDFLNRLPLAVEVALYLYDRQGAIEDFATIVDLPLANFGKPTPTPGREG